MNIVIPMAGRGQRFVDAGFETPKPLIDVCGIPMYARATESLPIELATKLIFVCLAEHLEERGLREDIERRYGHLPVATVALDDVTGGQAETVLAAENELDLDEQLIIFNADTTCRTTLGDRLTGRPDFDGLLGVFEADGDHWSFARTDDGGRVIETAEKVRISKWASTGLYHFTEARAFVDAATGALTSGDRSRGEFYVAPLYNRLIEAGLDIRIDVASEVRVMGTPEELAKFERLGVEHG